MSMEWWKSIFNLIVVMTCITFGVMRFFSFKGEFFQALSHIWVGVLIGYCIALKNRTVFIYIAFLVVVELYCSIFRNG